MTDVWSGDILLAGNTSITEVVLASQSAASSPIIPASALRFLSTVDTARIPLYLAAGPSFDVWTTSEDTQGWFESILLSKAPSLSNVDASEIEDGQAQEWWTCARSQSPVGILVQVDGGLSDGKSPRITEILFYGTIATDPSTTLISPPSSSPEQLREAGYIAELRVHALPLSSDLLHRPDLGTPDVQSTREAQFLPAPISLAPTSPKRKRDQFDEALLAGKKARRKGGQGIAAAAAGGKAITLQHPPLAHRKSMSIDSRRTSFSDARPASGGGAPSRPLSRAISRSPSILSDTRPVSKKGVPEGQAKRSMLSQVATVPLKPEEPTTESRNKEALVRVVLAAMRMHGFQQRKKDKSRRGSVAPGLEIQQQKLSEEAAAEEAAKDEEYKLIYSVTYKGAALALRKHITTEPLHLAPDRLGDVVERLLAIFCSDPLAPPPVIPADESRGSVLATPGHKGLALPVSVHSQASPFDMPSVNRAAMHINKPTLMGAQDTGSPVRRRLGKGGVKVANLDVRMEGDDVGG